MVIFTCVKDCQNRSDTIEFSFSIIMSKAFSELHFNVSHTKKKPRIIREQKYYETPSDTIFKITNYYPFLSFFLSVTQFPQTLF